MAQPIQDITSSPAQPTQVPSEPEIVSDIPVRAPASQPSVSDEVPKTPNNDPDFTASASPTQNTAPAIALSSSAKKDQEAPKTKQSKPKPIFAMTVALVAIICLAAGAYLKFIRGS